jgi:hypothetical protein
VDGYVSFIISVLALGAGHPSSTQVYGDDGGRELSHVVLQEGSDSQPSYDLEVYYDSEGKSYFCDGWAKFETDYDVHEGFFLVFSHRCGTLKFYVCIFDGTLCCRSYAPWL